MFARVSDSDPEMLRYLSERGIAPGDALEVISKEPFGGPITVDFAGHEQVLGGFVTRAIRTTAA